MRWLELLLFGEACDVSWYWWCCYSQLLFQVCVGQSGAQSKLHLWIASWASSNCLAGRTFPNPDLQLSEHSPWHGSSRHSPRRLLHATVDISGIWALGSSAALGGECALFFSWNNVYYYQTSYPSSNKFQYTFHTNCKYILIYIFSSYVLQRIQYSGLQL